MPGENSQSFLQELLNKKAMVLQVQEVTNKPQTAAVREVDRQIKQLLRGQLVTKSGEED
ncbi:MAG: hypothetical protein M3Q81_01120 [bacterium]|nr:hypothetical protein [bacterium]